LNNITSDRDGGLAMAKVSGIILAGGKSSRMGTNKALIELGQVKIIENIVSVFSEIFKDIIIVSNNPEEYTYLGHKVICDIIPCKGPLSGIHAGLHEAKYFHSFVAACDMPFIQKNLIELLVEECEDYDVTVPQLGKFLQPLYAVYSKNCIIPIEDSLNKNRFKITNFYETIKVKYINQDSIEKLGDSEKVFFNVNTKEDLEKAKNMN